MRVVVTCARCRQVVPAADSECLPVDEIDHPHLCLACYTGAIFLLVEFMKGAQK